MAKVSRRARAAASGRLGSDNTKRGSEKKKVCVSISLIAENYLKYVKWLIWRISVRVPYIGSGYRPNNWESVREWKEESDFFLRPMMLA